MLVEAPSLLNRSDDIVQSRGKPRAVDIMLRVKELRPSLNYCKTNGKTLNSVFVSG
nr:MAG TPA: hypothetical protein [Caudoviricetes sp.]